MFARHGKLAVRSSEGEIIDDKRLKEIAQDWAMLDEAMNEHGRDRPTGARRGPPEHAGLDWQHCPEDPGSAPRTFPIGKLLGVSSMGSG